MDFNCADCGCTSIESSNCLNGVCSNNPFNYMKMMSCVCGLPECIVCRDQILEQLEKEKQLEVKVQKLVCECGSEKVSGKEARHSTWCPKFME